MDRELQEQQAITDHLIHAYGSIRFLARDEHLESDETTLFKNGWSKTAGFETHWGGRLRIHSPNYWQNKRNRLQPES